jgi:CTP:molybdopterin cytidylyltransferase MocA
MGTDKARLNWIGGKTLLDWTVASLKAADWHPIVVVGLHNMPVEAPEERYERLVCTPSDDDRKTTSIAKGVAAVPNAARHILVVSVDQPRPIELYRALRTTLHGNSAPIVVPDKHGSNGHPVAVKAELRYRLLTLEDEKLGLRGLLQEFAGHIHRMPCDPEWLVWNCNTPSDYRTARAWFEARAGQRILEPKTATNSHPVG